MENLTSPKLNSSEINNILTLRYNPFIKTNFSRLTWSDFIPNNQCDPTPFIENSLKKSITNFINNNSNKKITIPLSGGIDSTLILTLFKKIDPSIDVNALSIKFADSPDETIVASKIASHLKVPHQTVFVENFLEELPKAISIVKQPFWDIHWFYVAQPASKISDTIVGGDGGDELFGGYTFRYQKFLSKINSNSTPSEKVKAYLDCHERDHVPDQEQLFANNSNFSWNNIHSFLLPYFENNLSPLDQVYLADFNGKLLYNFTHVNNSINDYFDLKYFTPLLSTELISFSSHIPNNLKYDQISNLGKLPLREILNKYPVSSFLNNTKMGFSVNTVNLWKKYGKTICKDFLFDSHIEKDGWIDGSWIRKYIDMDKLDVRYINKFFGLLAFEIWYRLFITKELTSNTKL